MRVLVGRDCEDCQIASMVQVVCLLTLYPPEVVVSVVERVFRVLDPGVVSAELGSMRQVLLSVGSEASEALQSVWA